jgi:hypothetical protein
MSKRGETELLANVVKMEITADVPYLTAALFGSRPPGMERLNKADYLERVRQNWGNATFRDELWKQVGHANFIKTYAETFGYDAETIIPGVTQNRGMFGG